MVAKYTKKVRLYGWHGACVAPLGLQAPRPARNDLSPWDWYGSGLRGATLWVVQGFLSRGRLHQVGGRWEWPPFAPLAILKG